MTTIETPRSPYARTPRRGVNWEKAGWVYMRVSGVILVVLILGHLFVNMMLGEGVKGIDFAFVAGSNTVKILTLEKELNRLRLFKLLKKYFERLQKVLWEQ